MSCRRSKELTEKVAEFKSQLAESRATVAILQQTQDALIARIQSASEDKNAE